MKKFVTINADKARNLRYTFNSLMILEEQLDKPITELGNNISFKDINLLVWAGLLHEYVFAAGRRHDGAKPERAHGGRRQKESDGRDGKDHHAGLCIQRIQRSGIHGRADAFPQRCGRHDGQRFVDDQRNEAASFRRAEFFDDGDACDQQYCG